MLVTRWEKGMGILGIIGYNEVKRERLMDILIHVFENFTMILVLIYLYAQIRSRFRDLPRWLEIVAVGFAFGVVGLFSMVLRVEITTGYFIDARTIMVALAGFFAGPLATVIAAVMVGAYRMTFAGVGLAPALWSLLFVSLISCVIYRFKTWFRSQYYALISLGVLVALGGLLPSILIPKDSRATIVFAILVPVVIVLPLVIYILGVVVISAEKRTLMEQELKELNSDLEEKVHLRTLDLEKVNHGLKEEINYRRKVEAKLEDAIEKTRIANKAKSSFLANMSHEIRTPLNALMGFTYMLGETELTDKQISYLEKMNSSSTSLINVINDILDFSKIEAGKIDLATKPFNLFDALNNLVDTVSFELNRKGLPLHLQIDPRIPEWVTGDEGRLSQILLNIMSNAVKFTSSGKIILNLEFVRNDYKENVIRFVLSDTGIGVKKEHINGLFDAFVQANMTINREFGGTGLGLAITRQLVGLMGGHIKFDSEYGEGSIVTVELPFEKAYQKIHRFETETNVVLFSARENFSEPLQNQLLRMDAHVEIVKTISLLRRQKEIDCVIIDWNQRVTSPELLYQLIKERIDSKTRVIFACYSRTVEGLKHIDKNEEGRIVHLPRNSEYLKKLVLNSDEDSQPFGHVDTELLKGFKVLIVEDNPLNQDIQSSILEEKEMIVTIAENGQVALDCFGQNSYDIILMDLHMPIMDGYEATRNIRLMEKYDHIPIIAMTADAQIGVEEKVKECGMDDYLMKPLNVVEVYKCLHKWLR